MYPAESHPVDRKIWVAAEQAPISEEALERLVILVPPKERNLRKRCEFEVLAFVTEHEWDTCEDEAEMKKRIRAKFRSYDEAEEYAQKTLLSTHSYYFKVLLRA